MKAVAFLCLALGWGWKCRRPVLLALASASSACAVFFATVPGSRDPRWLADLHLMAEAMAAASLLHLAAVFPIDRLGRRPEWVVPLFYLPVFLFGAVYQASTSNALTDDQLHLVATLALAAGGTAVVVTILHGLFRAPSILIQRQSALAAFAAAGAAAAILLTGMTDTSPAGTVLETIAAASLLLPVCVAYAASRQDSFKIDRVLRRLLAHALLLVLLVSSYAALFSPGSQSAAAAALVQSPIALAIVTFCVVLGAVVLLGQTEVLLDRLLFGKAYRVEQALCALGEALASTHTVSAVDTQTRNVLGQTVRPDHADLFLRWEDGKFRGAGAPAGSASAPLPTWRIARLERGELQLRRQEEGIYCTTEESSWTGLDAEVLVPISESGSLLAILALGPKQSGRSYNGDDVRFLRAAAAQIGLALSNAAAQRESRELAGRIDDLNGSLERQVQERSAALHASNLELTRSLEKLQYAYVKLEQSQANLLRSDRLATLGRLTAGLAHEMNTPLSAVLNSLKLIQDLSLEYRSSIDDAGVLPEDHQEIAAELISHVQSATEWANKAAAFIRSVKAHGREAGSGAAQRFAIRDVVADARGLVAHRLRATSCRIDLVEEPPGLTLDGDPSRFNQVLVNLLTNAIDAYEDRGIDNGRIEIRALQQNDCVSIQIRDWAGGIPTSILPHIFDELYTTKGPGRGTGLGLWISRNIVEEALGGTLDVITNSEGSCFLAELPQSPSDSPSGATVERPLGPTGAQAA